jgi:hypothetical protein
MLSLYFGLDVFCQFEARVQEFDTVFGVQCILSSPQQRGGVHVEFLDSSLK